MNDTLHKIVKDLEKSDLTTSNLGLHGGLMGLSLFFFYYSRFISNEKYENFAYEVLDIIVNTMDINTTEPSYTHCFAEIGSCIDFLVKENFIEIESEDFFEDISNSIFPNIVKSPVLDYSFQTGLIGLCNYFIIHQDNKSEDAVKITLDQLCSGFAVPGFPKHPVETILLMPSETLQDVKLFLCKIAKFKIYEEQISSLKSHIENFENKHTVLQSNCPEYYKIQYFRETIGLENRLPSKDILDEQVTYLSDKAIQGLTFMYSEKPVLPNIWKIL